MNKLNFIFLEEYKHLDKLCSELYDGQPGVTSYINDMKSVDWDDARCIPNWKADLNQLIHLRHIRNHLAHTEGAFNENLCTTEEVNWLKDFHKRILKQEDPLAMLRNCSYKARAYKREDATSEHESSFWGDLLIAVDVILVIIMIVYIVIKMVI